MASNYNLCYYYQMGNCKFGTRCRFKHEIYPNSSNNSRNRNNHTNIRHNNSMLSVTSSTRNPAGKNNVMKNVNDSADELPHMQCNSAIGSENEPNEEKPECGICFEEVIVNLKSRFGILPNCNHVYCLKCIQKWRRSLDFENSVTKSCPECRKPSEYVYSSKTWPKDKETKDKIIEKRNQQMAETPCRYFRKGKGKCFAGNTCLFRHALPNGKLVDVGPPMPNLGQRSFTSLENMMRSALVFDFLEYELEHDLLFDHDIFDSDDDLDLDEEDDYDEYSDRYLHGFDPSEDELDNDDIYDFLF